MDAGRDLASESTTPHGAARGIVIARRQSWTQLQLRGRSRDAVALAAPASPLRGQGAIALRATSILGIPVSIVDMAQAIDTILGWIARGQANFVCIRDVHGVMRAQDDPALMTIHQRAGMVTPDGMPLVWIARWRGHEVSRVCGPDLVPALAARSLESGLRHYFYGGAPGTADRMAAELVARFPGLQVAGTSAPPFRPLTVEEDKAATQAIVATQPHIVWVGLGTPKQEYWMRDHVARIPGATLIGVGASFDFIAGNVSRAPAWMQQAGLEWLHRLLCEPGRLWRRYLVLAPKFVFRMLTDGLRR